MRIPIIFVLLSFFLASCFAINGNNARNLILTEQELRFAGSSLRTVLASNSNSYRGQRGSRRFSGTFTIIERENGGQFDALINAEVELLNGNRNNGNRNRYPNNNYSPNSNYNPNNFGNVGPRMPGAGGYAGQYTY